ncbi:MAG TPA: YraN family protein [Gammaproteobacteria bacterium]|nr:YraN family protein [Gammaproteobacteria bacterium]
MSPSSRQRGDRAEQMACDYLLAQGLELYERNYRCRCGEIDLIMGDGASLAFIEVRYRSSSRFGSAAETVQRRKQARIAAAAARYLQSNPKLARRPARFDVVLLQPPATIEWIKDAFRIG